MDFDMGGDGTNFDAILDKVGNPPSQYHAFENNCVRFVLEACAEGGLIVPFSLTTVYAQLTPNSPLTAILAYTPAGMAQAMHSRKSSGDNRINTASNANVANSKGPC